MHTRDSDKELQIISELINFNCQKVCMDFPSYGHKDIAKIIQAAAIGTISNTMIKLAMKSEIDAQDINPIIDSLAEVIRENTWAGIRDALNEED